MASSTTSPTIDPTSGDAAASTGTPNSSNNSASSNTPPISSPQLNQTPDSVHSANSERKGKQWKISDEGLSFIGEWESGTMNGIVRIFKPTTVKGKTVMTHQDLKVTEGMILQVYLDNKGNPTVGCGHLVVPADKLKVGDTISLERARKFLEKNLSEVEAKINSTVNVPLHQYEYDALVSILFNTGAGEPAGDMATEVNKGNYANMDKYIKKFRIKNKKLIARRESEADLFSTGTYDASH